MSAITREGTDPGTHAGQGARALTAVFARRIVGLELAARRLIERLALVGVAGAVPGPVPLLTGPAGSGKTALIEAAAEALGRRVNVAPAGTAGPSSATAEEIVVIDLDALPGAGSPAASLLAPRRGVVVLATARDARAIPAPLRALCEEIRLPGFAPAEKAEIARRALLGPALAQAGEVAGSIALEDAALERLALAHSPEAGVALLAERLGTLVRRAAAAIALGEARALRLGAADVDRLLGPPRPGPLPRPRAEVGVAAAPVQGPDGAEVALVEAIRAPFARAAAGGPGRAALEAALAHVHAHAEALRIAPGSVREGEVSLRAPPGERDGDGADLAILLAVVSLATDRPVRPDAAAIGAISLRGAIGPVEGLAEKVLAAARAGARRVLVPLADFPRLERELSPGTLAALDVVPVARAEEAVRAALIDIVIVRELR